MVNRVIVMGKLVSHLDSAVIEGVSQCSFTIACTEKWKDKSGERKDRTERVRIVTYGRLAEACSKSLAIGQAVYVEGKLRTREYPCKDGAKRVVTEVDVDSMDLFGHTPKQEAADPFAGLPF